MEGVERVERGSDSPLIHVVSSVTYHDDVVDFTTPDGCWDFVIRGRKGRVEVLQTGLITGPIKLDYEAGDEYTSISFKPGVFMPALDGMQMLDRAVFWPKVSQGTFWLLNDSFEIPSFENAEDFVGKLVRLGMIGRDEVVERTLEEGQPIASLRTVQRRFIRATGMTAKHLGMVLRANQAAEMLSAGYSVADVTFDLGFADQPHLTRSMQQFFGRTPGQLSRAV